RRQPLTLVQATLALEGVTEKDYARLPASRERRDLFEVQVEGSGRSDPPICFQTTAMKDEIRELTAADFDRAIPRRLRDRLVRGDFKSGEDVAALRHFTRLSQETFALALAISVH